MPENKLVDIISDAPETGSVEFGFDAYAETIAGLIANKNNKTPLVIGIYGPWGSGKTTLMKTVKSLLEKEYQSKKEPFRKCKTVWFQAWKYNKEDEILAALIEEIFKAMEADDFFERCKGEIEKLTKKLDKSKIIGELSKLLTGVNVSEFFSDLKYKDKLGFYDTFQKFFDDLVWTYLNWQPKLTDSEKPDDQKGALVIFIDDLDRCPKERVLKVLETIKLFMDKEGCIFVIGAANEIIEEQLAETYGKEYAVKFMEKIVQVTFRLPRIPADGFESYVEKINPRIKKDISPYLDLIIPAMESNPRQFKRFVNNLNLLEGLLRNSGVDIEFNHLMFWNIIDQIYPALAGDIKERPDNLFTLQKYLKPMVDEIGEKERWEISQEKLKTIPRSFHGFVSNKQLVDIVLKFTIDFDQLNKLITLTGAIESPEEQKRKERTAGESRKGSGEMVEIPVGKFLYGDDKRSAKIEKPFEIDIYPVTNRRFEAFIKNKGYENDEYWSDEGKTWRKEKHITLPAYWNDEKWNQPEHPVVGVSYYEAEAYASWADKELPTEKQWERAARGIYGQEYPWGDEFDKERCNTRESGIETTTPVTRYPDGISPDGCYDMAGNVLEWTKSFYDEKRDAMVPRGGSWDLPQDIARCANRDRYHLNNRDYEIGFRCARAKK